LRKGLSVIGIAFLAISLLYGCASTNNAKIKKQSQAHYQLAVSHLQSGRLQDAFVELQRCIKLNPTEKRAYYLLGLIYKEFDDLRASEESLLKAIEIDPNYSEAYNALGVVYEAMGQWNKAIKQFELALKNPLYLSPEKALYNLGNAYYRQGKYEKALSAYKAAIKRRPEFHLPYYGLALSYNMLKRYGDAADALEEAIRLDPVLRGDRERAREYFRRMKLKATDPAVEQDYIDLLDILYY